MNKSHSGVEGHLKMSPYSFSSSLLSLSEKNCLFCSRDCDHFWVCGLLCVPPVEWFLLWVSVKLWSVNRLLEEPSHQVEGVGFWFLAVVQVYLISVSSPYLLTLNLLRFKLSAHNSSCLIRICFRAADTTILALSALERAFPFHVWRGWTLMGKPAMFKYFVFFWFSSPGSGQESGRSLLLWPMWLT